MSGAARLRALALLLSCAAVFAAILSINKIARDASVPYFGYFFWYCLGGGLVCGIAVLLSRTNPLPASFRHIRTYAVISVTGILAPMGLMIHLADKLPPSLIGLVVLLSPPLTYLIALVFKLERFRWLSVAGLALALAGVLALALPSASLPEPGMLERFLLALGAPVCLAVANVSMALMRPQGTSSGQLAAGILLTGATILLPFALITGGMYTFPASNPTGNWALLVVAPCATLRWWLMLELMRRAGAFFLSLFYYPAILASMALGVLLFGDISPRGSGWRWSSWQGASLS